MLNKFFQSFHEPKSSDENTFQSDLYNLIYEIIIADHEISPEGRYKSIRPFIGHPIFIIN